MLPLKGSIYRLLTSQLHGRFPNVGDNGMDTGPNMMTQCGLLKQPTYKLQTLNPKP